jgi:hypothetical protein
MFWFTAVRSHDYVDSRSTDMCVSQPDARHTIDVRYCFISLVSTCRFSSHCRLSTALRRTTYRLQLKPHSQAYFRQPQPGENQDVWISFTVDRNKKARTGLERRRDPSSCANVQPMLKCFQSDVVEPTWWRSVSKNVRRPVGIGEDIELMMWLKARRP